MFKISLLLMASLSTVNEFSQLHDVTSMRNEEGILLCLPIATGGRSSAGKVTAGLAENIGSLYRRVYDQ